MKVLNMPLPKTMILGSMQWAFSGGGNVQKRLKGLQEESKLPFHMTCTAYRHWNTPIRKNGVKVTMFMKTTVCRVQVNQGMVFWLMR
jgi:hypothetical protein